MKSRHAARVLGLLGRLCFVAFCLVAPLRAQSTNATINGQITDSQGKIVPGAEVRAINIDTNVAYPSRTNDSGIYVIPGVPPGRYRLVVRKDGFKEINKTDLVLHVQDTLEQNFALELGSISESVTVTGGAPLINTESATVSTVVDRKYVENMPLNGRSFQDLILLTPGVVTNSPQTSSTSGVVGEFSVNGQRTESNYYTVDGVSANTGIWVSPVVPSASGSLPAGTALGTTQSLVSIDALEEFRVQSSTYSAEYGRNPGGQFSFVTRSGTNQWHGTAFDYLRNNAFDANDWFNNYLGVPEPPLRQNDFGGTLGGAVKIPHVYDGKDKTFFFFSYEGLRLIQPQAASITYVPTVALRQSAASALQPVLNAFPLPNCPSSATNCTNDHANGIGDFVGSWSNPSQINSYSVRLDHAVSNRLRLFFRFSDTPSNLVSRLGGPSANPSLPIARSLLSRTYTLGASGAISSRISNELRLNYSTNEFDVSGQTDNFGGAQAVNLFQLQGIGTGTHSNLQITFPFAGFPTGSIAQAQSPNQQKQWNLTDAISFALGGHQVKVGADFRRSAPPFHPYNPVIVYQYRNSSAAQSNNANLALAISQADASPVYSNFSAFAQDQWRITARLNLSIGLRWDVNPAPGAPKGNLPYTVEGNSLSTLTLAPQGTPLWDTTWYNIAPRLGAAYVLRNTPGWETVVRGGGGVFFDSGQQLGSVGYSGPGFAARKVLVGRPASPVSFPLPLAQVPAIVNPPVAPYGTVYAFPSHLQLPFTLQWNASIEQALGKSQALTLSYVGANGRRLLEQAQIDVSSFNPSFGTIIFSRNGLTSDYNALQVQFQRRLARGLQALASYTWSHSIDYGSRDTELPYIRGNSDFDVRHNLSGAFSYDLPNVFRNQFARAILNHWGLDNRFTARTGFPVTLSGSTITDPATGNIFNGDLDLVPGQPVYVYGLSCAALYGSGLGCPGGRALNPNAFCDPSAGSCPGSIAPRNSFRGFGAWQMNLAVRREFPIYERLKLQFRAEAFNIFNHPNFGIVNPNYCSLDPNSPSFSSPCTFGQATATLANSFSGFSSLYQTGGARSMQFALKLIF